MSIERLPGLFNAREWDRRVLRANGRSRWILLERSSRSENRRELLEFETPERDYVARLRRFTLLNSLNLLGVVE